MWSPGLAVRAAIADRAHDLVQSRDAGFRSCPRERVPSSLLAGSVPGVGVGAVAAVAVVLALGNGVLLDQHAEGPAFQ